MSSGTSDLVAASSLDTYIRTVLFFLYTYFFYNYYSVCDIKGTREGVKQRRLEKFMDIIRSRTTKAHSHTHTGVRPARAPLLPTLNESN